jgi:CRP/FNR family cyclic AMP-dependent transcriptional regulator
MASVKDKEEERLLLIEKVLLLKSISLFEETPETILAEVAEILQEEEVSEGHPIFKHGDVGQCMYIIFKGEVRIHKDTHTFAILKKNEIFGELALLDTESRSASATAVTETFLLKIDQEPFYELMESRIEVAQGIIKTLCRRIKAQNLKAVEQKNGTNHSG